MEGIFTWMSQLTIPQAVGIFALLCFVLGSIPYGRYIKALLRYVVYRDPLVIERFSYHFLPSHQEIEREPTRPEFILKGSALMLSWKVTGAWKVDLEPVGHDLRGNAVTLVHGTRDQRFVLKAYGIFQKPVTRELQIPESVSYIMAKPDISRTRVAVADIPSVRSMPFTRLTGGVARLVRSCFATSELETANHRLQSITGPIHPDRIVSGGRERQSLYGRIDSKRILKGYTFSTRRYPNNVR